MRLLGKQGKPSDDISEPILAGEHGQPLESPPSIPPPTADPVLCPTCESSFYWQDTTGKVHCQGCVLVPAVRMVKDFWRVQCELVDGVWVGVAWVHRDPFAPHKFGFRSKVFDHLEREQQAQAEAASKNRQQEIF